MATLALQLPVFIASPSDAAVERDVVERVITVLAREYARDGIALVPRRWELDVTPGVGIPQDRIMPLLRGSELVIVILKGSLGSRARPATADAGAPVSSQPADTPGDGDTAITATLEELRAGMEGTDGGSVDDVFVYFWTGKNDAGGGVSRRNRQESKRSKGVDRFRLQLERSFSLLYSQYTDEQDFESKVEQHLRTWLGRWQHLTRIVVHTLSRAQEPDQHSMGLSENLYDLVRHKLASLDPRVCGILGRAAVVAYQVQGDRSMSISLEESDVVELTRARALTRSSGPEARVGSGRAPDAFVVQTGDGDFSFSSPLWYFTFCAVGLAEAIKENDVRAVEHVPYINPVHQLFSGSVHASPELRSAVVPQLRLWLTGREPAATPRPVVRNFAAYVLGMIGAKEVQDDLIEALEDRGRDVMRYAVTSLGKLRSRRAIPALTRKYDEIQDPDLQLLIGQALCRITGIKEYAL